MRLIKYFLLGFAFMLFGMTACEAALATGGAEEIKAVYADAVSKPATYYGIAVMPAYDDSAFRQSDETDHQAAHRNGYILIVDTKPTENYGGRLGGGLSRGARQNC